MTDLLLAVVTITVVSVPLALSIWALLDAARRPKWVWAFAGRNQVGWMMAIMFGIFLLVFGVGVSAWYLLRIRPELVAIEGGSLEA